MSARLVPSQLSGAAVIFFQVAVGGSGFSGVGGTGISCLLYTSNLYLNGAYETAGIYNTNGPFEKGLYRTTWKMCLRDRAWAVGVVTPEEIDEINILNASCLAMHRAVDLSLIHILEIFVSVIQFEVPCAAKYD